MESTRIRIARPPDALQILDIYRPIVADTAISFEEDPPSVGEVERRIRSTLETYPWLVCEGDGRLAGYAYAARLRTRPAYQWSVEVSAYTHVDARRSGVARVLYTSLLEVLKRQGLIRAFAGITLPNEGSVGLHEALGFKPLGVFRNVGHKRGRWHDLGWWQLTLQDPPEHPEPPVPFRIFCETDECDEALLAGESFLRLG
ncbi:MAG: GNAT family N-acetyltransferase [Gemmatimonadota bacterium]|nr:MAG: GNAT family N-acetyltransferase [Gemmatimonadota bacterium]